MPLVTIAFGVPFLFLLLYIIFIGVKIRHD